jgi:hypothetical protein
MTDRCYWRVECATCLKWIGRLEAKELKRTRPKIRHTTITPRGKLHDEPTVPRGSREGNRHLAAGDM